MSIKKILDDMDYGLAPENPDEVKSWLIKHNYSLATLSVAHLPTLKTSLNQ